MSGLRAFPRPRGAAAAAAVALALLAVTGCSPLNFAGEEALAHLPDEELCGRRSNLVNGALMARELSRRGVDCAPYDEAALRQGFRLGFLMPPQPPPPARSILPPSQLAPPQPPALAAGESSFAPPPVASGPVEDPYFQPFPPSLPPVASSAPPAGPPPLVQSPAPAQLASRAAPASLAAAPSPPPRPSAAPVAAATTVPPAAPPPSPPSTQSAAATAPFVTPACAAREVQQEEGRSTVAFRNTCAFPIRVLYAQRPDGALGAATGLLRPGEASPAAPIEAGFRQPGYVVCSYQSVPEGTPCRLQ